uniref:Uncharacterized protein n=1 Tax=Candidatus Kentrum sp. SD TaxID=2126332 RepID=A0A450YVN1_9GAMM|nr:MAG: hypothetical protein BECKSD772E_GA0070983_105615 [Candidatus Kentron sp. SD]
MRPSVLSILPDLRTGPLAVLLVIFQASFIMTLASNVAFQASDVANEVSNVAFEASFATLQASIIAFEALFVTDEIPYAAYQAWFATPQASIVASWATLPPSLALGLDRDCQDTAGRIGFAARAP